MGNRDLYDLEQLAITSLQEVLEDNPADWPSEPHDLIHEIADYCTPVYTGELMQLAADNIDLATKQPELGPAFDGSPTPSNIVAANVFEHLEGVLWTEWDRLNT